VEVTNEERVQAVADYGFTERQARFLVLVMRHAGVCVKRQYAMFAGIANGGEKCNAFFNKLAGRGYAVASDCVHNRARLFHVHHKPLYHAIGEPESRYRRAVPARRAIERLMRLDAALTSPDLEWLTSRSEKVAYLETRTPPEPTQNPFETTTRDSSHLASQCPGTFPIGIDPSGRVMLLYLATVPWTDDFRTFLVGHVPLLRVTPVWTLRLVFPKPLHRVYADYRVVVREELETPLEPATIYDLKRYFFHRRRGTDLSTIPASLRAFLEHCAQVFAGPRFALLYRRWLTEGDSVLTAVSPAIAEALGSGRAHVECVVLPHTYQHLSPLVSRRRSHRRRVEDGEQEGEQTSAQL
jgi:hypothetical protein